MMSFYLFYPNPQTLCI